MPVDSRFSDDPTQVHAPCSVRGRSCRSRAVNATPGAGVALVPPCLDAGSVLMVLWQQCAQAAMGAILVGVTRTAWTYRPDLAVVTRRVPPVHFCSVWPPLRPRALTRSLSELLLMGAHGSDGSVPSLVRVLPNDSATKAGQYPVAVQAPGAMD